MRLLEKVLPHGEMTAREVSQERYWRKVPKINLLPGRRLALSQGLMIRGSLALILVVELFLILGQYQGRTAAKEDTDKAKVALQAVVQDLSVEKKEIDDLRSRISQLKEKQGASAQAYKEVSGVRVNLDAALSALFGAQDTGVRLESLSALPGGQAKLAGTALDRGAMARFQSRLLSASDILEVQSIRWTISEASPTFSVTIDVKR